MTVLLSQERKDLHKSLQEIIETFLTEADFSRGFFLKPNIVFPVRKGSPEITSTTLLKALVTVLRMNWRQIDIVVGEGVAAGCDPQKNFTTSGFNALAKKLNLPIIDLNSAERRTIPWKFGQLSLPSIALERTYINLPILKLSSACVISGALKNQKGLVLPAVKKGFHLNGLHQRIAELNAVIKPALTIMDCRNFFGRNALISGDNCGEIDATACRLLSIVEPEHVQWARKAQVFSDGFSVQGQNYDLKKMSHRPKIVKFKQIGKLRLWSNPQACSMCRYVFQNIRQNILKPQNLKTALKLLPYTVKGAEMIMGKNAKWVKEYNSLICFGVCTREVAKEDKYIYIPGCPPDIEDLYKNLP